MAKSSGLWKGENKGLFEFWLKIDEKEGNIQSVLRIREFGVQNVILYAKVNNFFLQQNCVRQVVFARERVKVNE